MDTDTGSWLAAATDSNEQTWGTVYRLLVGYFGLRRGQNRDSVFLTNFCVMKGRCWREMKHLTEVADRLSGFILLSDGFNNKMWRWENLPLSESMFGISFHSFLAFFLSSWGTFTLWCLLHLWQQALSSSTWIKCNCALDHFILSAVTSAFTLHGCLLYALNLILYYSVVQKRVGLYRSLIPSSAGFACFKLKRDVCTLKQPWSKHWIVEWNMIDTFVHWITVKSHFNMNFVINLKRKNVIILF